MSISPQSSCSKTRCWTSSPLQLARRSEPSGHWAALVKATLTIAAINQCSEHYETRPRGIAQVSTAAKPWPGSVPLSAARNALPTRRPGQPANDESAAWESRPRAALCSKIRRQPKGLIPCLGTLYLLENLSQVDAGVRPARL